MTVLSLIFYPWRPKKTDSVTLIVFYTTLCFIRLIRKVLPSMFFFMSTNKKLHCYPLCFFSWRTKRTTLLPLMIFFWRPIKNDECYRPIHDDKKTTTVWPLMFYFIKRQCHPLCFFPDERYKTTVLPLMFYLVKKWQCHPLSFSMTTKENQQCYPYDSLYNVMFYLIKNDSVTLYLFFNDDQKNHSVTLMLFSMTTNKK